MAEPLVFCEHIVKIYKVADLEVVALQGLDLAVSFGEIVAIMGASGSGKSTLLNILSGLESPSAGRCRVANVDLTQLKPQQRLRYRRHVIGHVWQQSGRNLIADYTLRENLDVPQLAAGSTARQRRQRADELLEAVGLADKGGKYPFQLSGGEQQRGAIAVAIAHQPQLLLADEPTGELDSATTEQILALFRRINQLFAVTLILVTHDAALAATADRVVRLRDGRTRLERRQAQADGSAIASDDPTDQRDLLDVDPQGRLQLPQPILNELAIGSHVELRRAEDHLELWPIVEE